ncbi:MAG: hypothetical protein R3350_00895 [Saprospiraceae bacterium]|nr:hypothetical protein [Saprospiraceae bacterium]
MAEPPILNHPAIRTLRRAVHRERRLKLLASFALLVVSAALVYFFFDSNVVLTIIGLVGTVVGLRLLVKMARSWRSGHSRLLFLILHRPREIVWIYSVATQRMPFGLEFYRSGTMYFKLADGDEITVSLPAEKLKLVSRTLNRLLPHASFGYTRDREQWFMADPRMLLQEDE